jgi:CHASE1-domain containing sensor protein
VAGLFTASHKVTQAEFSRYVETLKFEDKFPGIQGVGFARFIKSKEKAPHRRHARDRIKRIRYPAIR